MTSREPLFENGSDRRKQITRAATAWEWLTTPGHVAPPTVEALPGSEPALRIPARRFGATPLGRLRIQATCDAIASGYLQGESMARFFTGEYPYDGEQLDSALSRGEIDWPRQTCGMDQIL
ncbi:MAG: hypothetical protein ABI903_04815 [Actinomycetota bacterium]